MSSEKPLVSIGLPVYNGEQWIRQALESLVSQDYENIEIMIADDKSTDNTPIICKEYSEKYDNIRFSINIKNLGGNGNIREILNHSFGKYFIWASQDDYWESSFVSILVKKLEADKRMVLSSGNIEMLNMDGSSYFLIFKGKWNPENLSQRQMIASLLLPVNYGRWIKNNVFIHGVIRTSALKIVFRYFRIKFGMIEV